MKGKSRIIARGLLGSKRTKRYKEAKEELCRRACHDPVARRALRNIAPDAHREVPLAQIQATRERLMEQSGGANTLRIRNEFVDRGGDFFGDHQVHAEQGHQKTGCRRSPIGDSACQRKLRRGTYPTREC